MDNNSYGEIQEPEIFINSEEVNKKNIDIKNIIWKENKHLIEVFTKNWNKKDKEFNLLFKEDEKN